MSFAVHPEPEPPPSWPHLVGELVDHVRALFRLEMALAKDEARRATVALARGAVLVGAAVLVALLGLQALVLAAVAGLATAWPWWLSAAVVGLVLCGVAGILVRHGLTALRLRGVRPSATIETLQETKAWLRSRA